jgi:hypothetical protein
LQYNTKKFMDYGINWGFYGRFKNQYWANWWSYLQPDWTYDYFEPRVEGKQFRVAPFYNTGLNFGTDERKKLSSYFYIGFRKREIEGGNSLTLIASPNYRVNDRLSIGYSLQYSKTKNDIGFATFDNNDNPIFGRRDRSNVEDLVSAKYAFSAKSNITFRARHYWAKATYKEHYKLLEDGNLEKTTVNDNLDRSSNFFNIDMIYTWQFAPGSFINLIWKNNISKNISGVSYITSEDYMTGLKRTFDTPQTNSLTLKVIYFVDYLDVKRVLKRR